LTFFPQFMLICPVTKKSEFIVPFSLPICAPLAQGVKILTHALRFELGLHICL